MQSIEAIEKAIAAKNLLLHKTTIRKEEALQNLAIIKMRVSKAREKAHRGEASLDLVFFGMDKLDKCETEISRYEVEISILNIEIAELNKQLVDAQAERVLSTPVKTNKILKSRLEDIVTELEEMKTGLLDQQTLLRDMYKKYFAISNKVKNILEILDEEAGKKDSFKPLIFDTQRDLSNLDLDLEELRKQLNQ